MRQTWIDFRSTSLCVPGVVVFFADGTRRLIGDINKLGGAIETAIAGADKEGR